MGAKLAKCLPPTATEKLCLCEAIPDKDVLLDLANRISDFEDELKAAKEEKAKKKATKDLKRVLQKVKGSS